MILHFHFHFKSFPGHAQKRERARERKRAQPATPSDPTTDTDPAHVGSRRAQPFDHRSFTVVRSSSQTTQTLGEWELSHKLTPIQTNTPDLAHSGSLRAQPVNHRSSQSDHWGKHRLTVSFPEPVDRFSPLIHTLTSDPHTSDPHTHLTSDPLTLPIQPILPTHLSIRSLHFKYIYLFIYLLIFLIIHFLLNCVFMGYVYEILELDWFLQVIHDWFLLWFFFRILEHDWLFMIGFCCDFFLEFG